MQLHHEKLDAYQVSTEFLGFAFKIIKNMPPGYGKKAKILLFALFRCFRK